MKALVLGATGHVGNAVVRELLHRDFEVTAACRRPETAANLEGLDVRRAAGDADVPGQLAAWVAGHDLVVDAAAAYPLHLAVGRSARQVLAAAERRMEALLAAAGRYGARLAHVSSFTTKAPSLLRRGLPAFGALLARRFFPYFAVKERLESQVLAAARHGLPALAIRPTTFLGPWDLKPRRLCFIPRLLAGEIPAPPGRHVLNVVDVRDVAHGLVAAILAQRYGETLRLVGHNISTDRFSDWICQLGGTSPPSRCLPFFLTAAAQAGLEASVGRSFQELSLATILTWESHAMLLGKAQRELGVLPRPLSDTLLDAVVWYRRLGYC